VREVRTETAELGLASIWGGEDWRGGILGGGGGGTRRCLPGGLSHHESAGEGKRERVCVSVCMLSRAWERGRGG